MDRIEHQIKARLYDHSSTVGEHIWSGVESRLQPKRKNKSLLVILIGALLLSLTSFAGYRFISPSPTTKTDTPTTIIADDYNEVLLKISELKVNQIPRIQSTHSGDNFYKNNHDVSPGLQIKPPKLSKVKAKPGISISKLPTIKPQEIIYPPFKVLYKEIEKSRKKSNRSISINPIHPLLITPIRTKTNHIKVPTLCPNINGRQARPLSLSIYTSLDYPLNKMNSTTGESQQGYIDQRNRTESGFLSFHSGIRIEKPILNNFSIRIGAEYAQVNERFQLIDSGAVRVQTVIDSIFAPDGRLIDIQTNTITESGVREVNHYNHLKSLTIPVSVGFNKQLKKTTLHVHAGAQFTILSSYSGKILSPQLSTVTIGKGSGAELSPYKNNLGINIIGSIGVSMPISESWSLLLEPNFRYSLKSITASTYPINQKYLIVGLSSGIRYNF